jgi:hypothetical protein
VKGPGENEGAHMNAGGEAAMPQADETGAGPPDPMADSIAAGMKPAGSRVSRFGPDLFDAEPAPLRPPAALQRLMKSLESRAGKRGARLAAINLRAGIAPPAPRTDLPGAEGVQAALWMELARENATLRREAARLVQRQHSLSRRIDRAKTRVHELRLKLIERRLTLGGLPDIPLGDARREPTLGERSKRSAGEPNSQIEPLTAEPGEGEARTEKD